MVEVLQISNPDASADTSCKDATLREAAFALRMEVFVGEQKCDPENELDEHDSTCMHWVALKVSPTIFG